jgi:hypothetical protein
MVSADLAGGFFCRNMNSNDLTGTMPTELARLTSMQGL